jgi:alkyldihydroxyacetonephosphate synthase
MAERAQPAEMRWWGWGDPAHPPALPAHALRFLRATVGVAPRPSPPVALERVRLERPALSSSQLAQLRDILGADGVCDSHRERVLHAAGKGYPDLVRMRGGEPDGAPDAVLYPHSHEQIRAVLELCARSSLAVVPFGGGTSVVGGVAPLRGQHGGVLALDMARMGRVLALDRESRTVTVQAGMRAPALERELGEHGLTLGHFPQSYEYVSLGGCAATRSAGQASTGYGAIEKMVLGMRFAAPAGDIELAAMPASAAGPGLRQLLIGSEGTLGVISELSLRVRPAPRERIYEGVFFEDFQAGTQALQALAREHALPDVARLSDQQETRMSLALAGRGGVKGVLGRAYLGARGYGNGCLAIFGYEGADPREALARRKRALELLRGAGGLAVGRSPGEAWLHGRFSAPYLRDELLTQGVMVETLETATQWSNLTRLHGRVTDAISAALDAYGTPGLVMCHVSHLYETGASLYFTLIARQSEHDTIAQWHAVKLAAGDAILDGGGTITHHHAIGRDHAPWMQREIGDGGVDALRALKAQLDPAGIMNPEKLLPTLSRR